MSRVAIYARVSKDEGQDAENQLAQLRAWCVAAGHEIVGEYVDQASGAKGADKRPQFGAMLADAHQRRFDLILVWALDRLSREGMVPTIGYLQRLASYGVAFHSYTEPMLSTDNEMVRDIVLAVMSSLAKVERARISERTKAGLARVRAKGSKSGKPIGRPALAGSVQVRIATLARDNPGMTAYAIARQIGCDVKTVAKYARAARVIA
jgi:DNA invertase Pin-like site-specific DNA recombinase